MSTRNILRRKLMAIDSYNCVLCSCSTEETFEHLFFDCNFAQQCWSFLGVNIPSNSTFPEIISTLRAQLLSKFFMVAVILLCWSIWTARNGLIFNGIHPSVHNCKRTFLQELKLVQSLQTNFESWISSLNLDH